MTSPSQSPSVDGETLQQSERLMFGIAERAYFKAGETSDPQDWLQAGLMAQQHRNALTKYFAALSRSEAPVADEIELDHKSIDYTLEQLCKFLGIDVSDVTWDAATETVDGDVQAVIGNILRAKYGENFDPPEAAPSPDTRVREALDELQSAESTYRMCHDIDGDGHINTGRAWVKLRQAGARARSALATLPQPGAVEHERNVLQKICARRADVIERLGYHPDITLDELPKSPALDPATVEAWQPIETAPKDGSHILAYRLPIGIRFTNNTNPPTVVHWFDDGFYTSVNEIAPERPFNPTHWKPLDAPPRALAGKDGA